MRARLPVVVMVVSALAVIATPVAVWAGRARPDVGSVAGMLAETGARSSSVGVASVRATAIGSPSGPAVPNIVVRSARLEDYVPPRRGPRPVGLSIGVIDMHARVVPVGVEDGSRTVEVPADVDVVGWFRFGPTPGMSGSAVLIGHVDSRTQGAGAFFRLRELEPGDVVSVAFANGSRSPFRVVARRSYPKDELPEGLFRRTGRPALALVTCGGAFDRGTRSYSDNVVVFAVPFD